MRILRDAPEAFLHASASNATASASALPPTTSGESGGRPPATSACADATIRWRRPSRSYSKSARTGTTVPVTSPSFCNTSGTSLRPSRATSAGWLSGSIVRPAGEHDDDAPVDRGGQRVLEQEDGAREACHRRRRQRGAHLGHRQQAWRRHRRDDGHGGAMSVVAGVAQVDHRRDASRLRGQRKVERPGVLRTGSELRDRLAVLAASGVVDLGRDGGEGPVAGVAGVDLQRDPVADGPLAPASSAAPARAVAAHASTSTSATRPATGRCYQKPSQAPPLCLSGPRTWAKMAPRRRRTPWRTSGSTTSRRCRARSATRSAAGATRSRSPRT